MAVGHAVRLQGMRRASRRAPNALLLGFGLLAVFWLSRRDFPDAWGGEIGLFVVMLAVGLPITWWMTRVETAD